MVDLKVKLDKISDYLKDKKILIAFSGGADSTLLAKLAKDSSNEAVAVTVDNGVLPADCIASAQKIAAEIGIPHKVLRENYLEDESFSSNPPQRCFICKNKMYEKLEEYALAENFEAIADGTNISDLLEDRPGIMVNFQKNILIPLVHGGMTAEDVRNAIKMLSLEYSPSTTCYATRIPTGTEITTKKINRIAYAETLIKNISGVNVVRVRDEGDQALIEVSNVDNLLDGGILSHINNELNAVGFKRVAMDISGYGDLKKDMVIYKPCKDEANKIMFETKLPYEIDIPETCNQLEQLGQVKCSSKMGVAMIELEGRNITLFKKGKIVARRVKDKEDAQDLMVEILPYIRRVI